MAVGTRNRWLSRIFTGLSPRVSALATGLEAFAAVFASVLPDLIDKPLAWEYGVFQSGYALGHSIFFAVPLSIAVGLLAHWVGRGPAGIAFGVGYLLHLPSDVLDGYLREGQAYPELMLWPLETVTEHDHGQGFTDQFWLFFNRYHHDFLAGDLSTYMWVQLGLASVVALLWLYDGAPVLRELVIWVTRGVRALLPGQS